MQRARHLFGRALRETGQAMDRTGLTISNNEIFRDTFSRHRSVMNLFDKRPSIAAGVFVAPNASVVGECLLYNDVSVWYGAVLRADKSTISVGHQSNIQDRAVIGTVSNLETGFPSNVEIGDQVTVGHGALITSSKIGNRTLIGQGAVICEGCEIGNNCMVAAGAVVLPGTLIPDGQMWAGNPAKHVRDVTDEERAMFVRSAASYVDKGQQHAEEFLPYGTLHQEAEKL